jgi:hypothetical protein
MQKKWVVINVLVLVIIVLSLSWMSFKFLSRESVVFEECIDVNNFQGFIYDACYDSYSKIIFLKTKRGADDFQIRGLQVSFFDVSEQDYKFSDVFSLQGVKAYRIPSENNPNTINLNLDVVKDFPSAVCNISRRVFVSSCVAGIQGDNVDAAVDPSGDVSNKDVIQGIGPSAGDFDFSDLSLGDREKIWRSVCASRWSCDSWGSCEDGVETRNCVDSKNCFVSVDSPETVRYCDGQCVEDWSCEWSGCKNGFTVPKCDDLNNCGTAYDIPKKLDCSFGGGVCISDVECGGWSDCNVDYGFLDLLGGSVANLNGYRSRICIDKNSCIGLQREIKECSVSMDVRTNKFVKCGEDYLGIYDDLNDNLIASVEIRAKENPRLNIYFDERGDTKYCNYCFDGEMNGDEESIDCGGSCPECGTAVSSKERSLWEDFIAWINGI